MLVNGLPLRVFRLEMLLKLSCHLGIYVYYHFQLDRIFVFLLTGASLSILVPQLYLVLLCLLRLEV